MMFVKEIPSTDGDSINFHIEYKTRTTKSSTFVSGYLLHSHAKLFIKNWNGNFLSILSNHSHSKSTSVLNIIPKIFINFVQMKQNIKLDDFTSKLHDHLSHQPPYGESTGWPRKWRRTEAVRQIWVKASRDLVRSEATFHPLNYYSDREHLTRRSCYCYLYEPLKAYWCWSTAQNIQSDYSVMNAAPVCTVAVAFNAAVSTERTLMWIGFELDRQKVAIAAFVGCVDVNSSNQ